MDLEALMQREFIVLRIRALWEHSPVARRAVQQVLDHLGVVDPRSLPADDRAALCAAVYDLEGTFREAEERAYETLACAQGANIARGGGSRADAARWARDYLPDRRDDVIRGWERERALRGNKEFTSRTIVRRGACRSEHTRDER